MRLHSSWFGNDGKPVMTADGPRFQIRWRVLRDGSRRPKECKQTTFVTKAKAKYFLEELDKAHHGVTDPDGRTWRFDAKGRPTNLRDADTTVIGAIELYMKNRWTTQWKPSQRTKVRGRMQRVAIQLTTLPKATKKALFVALDAQRTDRGQRQEPTSREEWAARWLRDVAFFPNSDVVLSDEILAAKNWLEQHSMALCALSVSDVTDLRLLMIGDGGGEALSHNTRRAYWNGVVVPFFRWLYETGMVEKSLTRGQPPIKRDMEGERPDPNMILEPSQVAALAGWFRKHYGPVWELYPLISTFCALRIGEALNIRLSDFFERNGRWYLGLGLQIHSVTKAYSDDGRGKQEDDRKSQQGRKPRDREIPLPPKVAKRLIDLFGDRLGRDGEHLFRGPRGAVGNSTDVRKWFKKALNEVVVPSSPQFAGLTPHGMRHAGMTYWFSQKFDEKLIQRWGGWESVVVMQDTYRGVLDSLEVIELKGLDRFDETWEFESAQVLEPTADASRCAVITDLTQWRLSKAQMIH